MHEPRPAPPVSTLMDVRGRIVVVTGASRGIGLAIATRLAEAGMIVALAHRDPQPLEEAVGALRAAGAEVDGLVMDVSVETKVVAAIADLAARRRRIDALVNCAGIQPLKNLLDQTAEDWDAMLGTNARGVFLCTREAAKVMIEQGTGGSIVNIASIEASQPAWSHSHYNASKAAVKMHTRAAALELGRHGIRVNSVSPGLIWRADLEESWPEGVRRWLDHAPLGRLGLPDDISDAVLFLLSPMSRWISGADLVVDGGMLAHPSW